MSFLVWFFFEQQFKPHVADKLHIISEILLSRPFLKNVKPLEAGSLHISIFTQFPDLRKLADSLDVDPLVNSHRGSHLWLTFYPEVGNNSILWNHRNIMEFFLSLKFVSSVTSSAVMGTPSSSNSCWKVRTGEIIERLILNWEDWIIVTVNHTNKGSKMLKIQTRSEDSSITHSTSPVKDTSLGDKLENVVLRKIWSFHGNLDSSAIDRDISELLPFHYDWDIIGLWKPKTWETFVMLHWTFFFDGCQN